MATLSEVRDMFVQQMASSATRAEIWDGWMQLTQPYHDSGRCLEGWARLRLGRVPSVVE